MKNIILFFIALSTAGTVRASDKCIPQVDQELNRMGMGSFYHPSSCYNKIPALEWSHDTKPGTSIQANSRNSKSSEFISAANKSVYYNAEAQNNDKDPVLRIHLTDLLGQKQIKTIRYNSECKVKSVTIEANQGDGVVVQTIDANSCLHQEKSDEIALNLNTIYCHTYNFDKINVPKPTAADPSRATLGI